MQDKETKKRFENFVTEECGDSLWGNDGTDNYDTAYDVKDKVWDFISKLEQEAERRGAISLYKELDDLDIMLAMLHSVEDTNDEEVHKIVGNIRNELKKTLDKLKLLEEENGKQNAR